MMADVDALIDTRSDPDARSVLEDYERSHFRASTVSRFGFTLSIAADADADADAAADAAAADAAADAAAAAAAAADADASTAATAAATAAYRLTTALFKEPDMQDGIKVFQIPGTYGSWSVTIVGWIRRVSGDEWEVLPGARTIRRTGSYNLAGLDRLANEGNTGNGYALGDAAIGTESLHRLLIRRCLPANEKAWERDCPRPASW